MGGSVKGAETNYLSKLYAGPLDGPVMRGYMQISTDCCADFGTMACIKCPLEVFIPHCVPACGMKGCSACANRPGCPCGNEELRKTLLEEIGTEITLMDREALI